MHRFHKPYCPKRTRPGCLPSTFLSQMLQSWHCVRTDPFFHNANGSLDAFCLGLASEMFLQWASSCTSWQTSLNQRLQCCLTWSCRAVSHCRAASPHKCTKVAWLMAMPPNVTASERTGKFCLQSRQLQHQHSCQRWTLWYQLSVVHVWGVDKVQTTTVGVLLGQRERPPVTMTLVLCLQLTFQLWCFDLKTRVFCLIRLLPEDACWKFSIGL